MSDTKVIKKRGRPKKCTNNEVICNINTEHELILFYPYKLCDFNNNLDQPTNVNSLFNNDQQKVYVDEITKNQYNNEDTFSEFNSESNIVEISSLKAIEVNKTLTKCPFSVNGKIIIPDKTDICCMYDTCKMRCKPVFLPDKYLNGSFHIIGWFCSISCAISYNLRINDENVNKRMNLLYYLYNIHNPTDIKPSPDILLLKKYGGDYTIDQYRQMTNKTNESPDNFVYDTTTIELI